MEGPSIVILAQESAKFVGKRVLSANGSSKIAPIEKLEKQKLVKVKSWGKHFVLQFERTILRVHFMLFGSYRIDEPKPDRIPRLRLEFSNGDFLFYACSIREIDAETFQNYDDRADIMSAHWDESLALNKLKLLSDNYLCDVLLHQDIFAGVGNIIKNEVLFRRRLQPTVKVKNLSELDLRALVRETQLYSLQFYIWKKQFLLRKHWQMYKKSVCPSCGLKVTRRPTGKFKRRSFFCAHCQKLVRKKSVGSAHGKFIECELEQLEKQIRASRRTMSKRSALTKIEKEH